MKWVVKSQKWRWREMFCFVSVDVGCIENSGRLGRVGGRLCARIINGGV